MDRILILVGAGAFMGAVLAVCLYAVWPAVDEVSPHLDPAPEGRGDSPPPALRSSRDFIESTLVVRNPYQFCGDAENGDWCFTEEWEDGTIHQVRIHFTTVSAQGSVTQWVEDALLVKAGKFLEGTA